MSKRAEEAALKAYPEHCLLMRLSRGNSFYADNLLREGFVKGYEQALSDIKNLIDSNVAAGYASKIIRLIEQDYE